MVVMIQLLNKLNGGKVYRTVSKITSPHLHRTRPSLHIRIYVKYEMLFTITIAGVFSCVYKINPVKLL